MLSSVLAQSCEQRGLSSELVDLATTDPEERLLEEVCCLVEVGRFLDDILVLIYALFVLIMLTNLNLSFRVFCFSAF
jgi:hypothetical protein